MFNKEMFERAEFLYKHLQSRYPKDKALNHLICCTQISKEVSEVLDCVEWKFEREDEKLKASREKLLEEMVDVFKFYCRLLCIHNVTPEEFEIAFLKKSDKVVRRLLCQEIQEQDPYLTPL